MKLEALVKCVAFVSSPLLVAGPAMAHGFDDCTKEAKDKWKPQAEAEAAATAAGYTVTDPRSMASCYEVYAKDKDGKKFELFYNPVDLQLVKAGRLNPARREPLESGAKSAKRTSWPDPELIGGAGGAGVAQW